MRVVIALGGNALLKRGEQLSADVQRRNVKVASAAISNVILAGHEVIITHGNGPQVGLMALQDAAYDTRSASPLDVLCAESQGMIGYMIAQELQNLLNGTKPVAVLLTRVEVDPRDPAFRSPSKPIGPLYSQKEAEALAATHGWAIMADGEHFRRAVPSPRPVQVLEIGIIRQSIGSGTTTICAGGGGIPVVRESTGHFAGVEAVIDKDHSSRMVACETQADALLMLTDVDGLYLGWGTQDSRMLRRTTTAELKRHSFARGTMAPKVEAAIDFVSLGGCMAGIGRLQDALAVLSGQAGTRIEN